MMYGCQCNRPEPYLRDADPTGLERVMASQAIILGLARTRLYRVISLQERFIQTFNAAVIEC